MQSQMNPIIRVRACAFAGLALLLMSGFASAQTEAEDIRARVKERQKVSITDDQGREFNGRITTIAADSLIVTPDRAPRVVVPFGQIVKIDRPHDTLANGALIGFGVGAALGFGLLAADDAKSCDPGTFFDCSDPTGAGYIATTLVVGGLGYRSWRSLRRDDPIVTGHLSPRWKGSSRPLACPGARETRNSSHDVVVADS